LAFQNPTFSPTKTYLFPKYRLYVEKTPKMKKSGLDKRERRKRASSPEN